MEEGEPAAPSSSSVVIRNRDFKNNNNNNVSKTGAKRKLPSTSIASQKSESRIRGRIHQNGAKNIRKRKVTFLCCFITFDSKVLHRFMWLFLFSC